MRKVEPVCFLDNFSAVLLFVCCLLACLLVGAMSYGAISGLSLMLVLVFATGPLVFLSVTKKLSFLNFNSNGKPRATNFSISRSLWSSLPFSKEH